MYGLVLVYEGVVEMCLPVFLEGVMCDGKPLRSDSDLIKLQLL